MESTIKMTPAALELTHVLYDAESHVSLAFALVTLSPILLMASYAALAVVTRELVVINMWAGQLLCEVFNWLLKHAVKQERPLDSYGSGYGFPSSHSQYMGYFSTFLAMHLFFRHKFTSTGSELLDQLWRLVVYAGLITWAGAVCYSRLHLTYHSPEQVLWGVLVGIVLGIFSYLVTELIPVTYPASSLGRFRAFLLENPVSTWLRLRDGWALWPDGGREEEWKMWRKTWERQHLSSPKTD